MADPSSPARRIRLSCTKLGLIDPRHAQYPTIYVVLSPHCAGLNVTGRPCHTVARFGTAVRSSVPERLSGFTQAVP